MTKLPTTTMNLILASLLMVAIANSSQASVIVYSNDFETNTTGFSDGSQIVLPDGVSTSTFLAYFSGAGTPPTSTSLSLTGLQAGNTYTLSFDLYAGHSLDGDTGPGPDTFSVTAGTTTMLDATFTNVSGFTQTYSDATPLGDGGPFGWQTGADVTGFSGTDALYRFDGIGPNPILSFVATGPTETIDFASSNLQNFPDEFFAIDNVLVTTTDSAPAPVPEPTSLAIWSLLGGIGLIVGHRRRRRKAALQTRENGD